MRNVMRKFRKIILEEQLKNCETNLDKTDLLRNECHERVLKMIREGYGKLHIKLMRYRRKQLHKKILRLIDRKYDLMGKIVRAS